MLEYRPDRQSFKQLSRGADVVPVYCSLLSDHLTPVSAFERLAESVKPDRHAFLLESVVGGEKIARYSFLGAAPIAHLEVRGRQAIVTEPRGVRTSNADDPLVVLQSVLGSFRSAHPPGMPRFMGGAVGYAAYDLARQYEKLGTPPLDDRGLPDLQFGVYDEMVIFDHVRKLIHVVAHARTDAGESLDHAHHDACARIEALVAKLADIPPEPIHPFVTIGATNLTIDSTMTVEQFEQAVERSKAYIRAGDIYQVVLSQRLTAQSAASPFDLYRALRVINPSPFMFYVQSPSVTLVGASPEILCRLEGRKVSTRPLAGTRPRGRTEAEDRGLESELLADPKERAEHVMLVDLGRNDLGRVCEHGSVTIDDLMSVERYSHVMHICSNVSGTLAPGKTAFDALRSVLPVGTVSGAPKIRAMQIIDELEPVRRGPYAGAVGYLDFTGNMDTCITLRTLVITPGDHSGWRVDAQVGAGIVADSEPSQEYLETLNKAQSMLGALKLAQAWSDA